MKVVSKKQKVVRKAVKIVGEEYVFSALVLPYGGHNSDDTDCHGQRFTAMTDFKTEALPYPPIVYAHGYAVDEGAIADRHVVGRTIERWYDDEGGWALVGINKTGPLAEEIRSSYVNGTLKFSSGALLASLNDDGQSYDVWLPGEFSVVTDKTPLKACNLLTRAEQYGKTAMESIFAELPEAERANLEQLIAEADVASSEQPAGGRGDEDDLEAFADGNTEDEMKPEEMAQAIKTALEPFAARLTALEQVKPEPVTPAPAVVDDKQKTDTAGVDGDLTSFIDGKAERHKVDAGVNTLASKLVDGYIASNQVAPTERLPLITLASAAINADGRKKTVGGALDAFIATIEGRQPVAIDPKGKLAGFGVANPNAADAADVASMFKAVQAE